MNEKKSVNSLKRQMTAAIAMVLVAGIALASATYAWFVSNNEVSAKTTQIKAQSNTAFMSIEYKKTAVGSTTTLSKDWYNEGADTVALYPAEVQKGDADAPKFITAYGTSTTDGKKKGSDIVVGDAAKAVKDSYAIGEADNYSISSAGVDLTDLVIKNIEVSTGNDKNLAGAVRVLVVGPNSWQVWKAGTTKPELEKTTNASLATKVAKDTDTKISVYVYYDGNDEKVFTANLTKLEEAVGVTINFSATQPTTVSTSN